MRRPLAGEGGAALLMTVAFMALAVPLITGALGLASTLSIDSRVKARILQSQYAAIGGSQHGTLAETGNYCNEPWVEPGGRKTGTGKTAKVQIGTPTNAPCEGPAVSVSKTVTPEVVPGNTPTVCTYTIAIENVGTVPLYMSRIQDLLPQGFLYTSGRPRCILLESSACCYSYRAPSPIRALNS